MTDEAEIEVPVSQVPNDLPDDDDPPLEPVPENGTPEDGVMPALFGDETDPGAELESGAPA